MTTTPRLPALIDAATLDAHRGDPQLRIFDATVLLQRPPEGGPYEVVSGRAGYDAGHIPGAAFADLAGDLADPDSPFAFTLPSAERFARAAGALGIGDGVARRRLRAVGADVGDAAVVAAALLRLRRRLRARRRPAGVAGGRASRSRATATTYPPATFTARAAPRAAGDSRRRRGDRARRGARLPRQRALAGGLPRRGTELLQPPRPHPAQRQPAARDARRPGDEPLPAAAGAASRRSPPPARSADQPVVAYCGGGISATVDVFAFALAGRDDVKLYDGSLTEWTADPELPLEVG